MIEVFIATIIAVVTQRLLTRVLRLVGRIARLIRKKSIYAHPIPRKNQPIFSRKIQTPQVSIQTPKPSVYIQDKGKIGEITVANHLGQLPYDDYKVMHDVMIQTQNGTSQIDHLIVSKYGIFVIETKNYCGKIYGNANDLNWTQYVNNAKHEFYNPVRQNEGHVRALRSILSDYGNVSIFPIVVFTGDVLLKVNTYNNMVIYAYQLLPKINELKIELLNSEQVDYICKMVLRASLKTDDPDVMVRHQVDVDMAKMKCDATANNLG